MEGPMPQSGLLPTSQLMAPENPKVIETAYELARLRGGRGLLFGVAPRDDCRFDISQVSVFKPLPYP